MKFRTLVILVAFAFGMYKGIYAVGGKVDKAMGTGDAAAPAERDVQLALRLEYKDKSSRASADKFDSLSQGIINLRGTVKNNGPAARSIQVRITYQDQSYGAPERSEVVDLGAFDHGETRSFDDVFTNTLGALSKDGKTKNYSLDYRIVLEKVVPRSTGA